MSAISFKSRRRGNFDIYSGHSYYLPGSVADIIILLVWLVVGVALANVATFIFTLVLGSQVGTEFSMIISYPLQFLPAMLFAASKSRAASFTNNGFAPDSNNFAPHSGFVCALLVVVGTLAAAFASDAIGAAMPAMPAWLEKVMNDMVAGELWANFLCVSIMAPFFEEWLCRGMILRGLLYKSKVKPVWAIVISAAFFALIHLNPWQAIPAFILGCLFGYVYYKTGSLKLTMLMHFANNTMALIVGRIPSLEGADNWMSVLGPGRYWAYFVLALVVLGLVVVAFKKIKTATPQGACDPVEPLIGSAE